MRAAILQSVLLFSVTAVLFAFRGVERAQQRQFAQGIARAAHGEKDLAQKCEDPRAVYDTRSAAQDSDDRAHRAEKRSVVHCSRFGSAAPRVTLPASNPAHPRFPCVPIYP